MFPWQLHNQRASVVAKFQKNKQVSPCKHQQMQLLFLMTAVTHYFIRQVIVFRIRQLAKCLFLLCVSAEITLSFCAFYSKNLTGIQYSTSKDKLKQTPLKMTGMNS